MFYFFFFFIFPLVIIWQVGGRIGGRFAFVGLMLVISMSIFLLSVACGVALAEGFSMIPHHGAEDYFHMIGDGRMDFHLTTMDMWEVHSMGYAALTWGYYLLYDLLRIVWQLNVYHPNGYLFFGEAIGIIWIVLHPFAMIVQLLVNAQEARRMQEQ